LALRFDFREPGPRARRQIRRQAGTRSEEEAKLSDQQTGATGTGGEERPIFRFSYRSVPFRVHLRGTGPDTTGRLEALIGVMPFTVDGDSLRSNMLALISKARCSDGYGIAVAPNHAIHLSVTLPIDGNSTADAILAAAIERLAGAKPFLDLVLSLQPPHLRKITLDLSERAA
jgi:hypothetical protein